MIAAVILTGLTDSLMPGSRLSGVLALIAAALHAARLSGWRGLATRKEPLLFVLHAAYGCLAAGYLLLGLSKLGLDLPDTGAIHALTAGAIGSTILAVMTRVALGHTGRALKAASLTVLAYWLLGGVAVLRTFSPLASPGRYLDLIDLSAIGWTLCFSIFLWVYWPVLTGPTASSSQILAQEKLRDKPRS